MSLRVCHSPFTPNGLTLRYEYQLQFIIALALLLFLQKVTNVILKLFFLYSFLYQKWKMKDGAQRAPYFSSPICLLRF